MPSIRTASTVWHSPRDGKRETYLSDTVTRLIDGRPVQMRRIMHLVYRTIDKHGQTLLIPLIDIEGWTTSLTLPIADVIALYQAHGTHEQFHSEFKSDLDLERLPSGKFATNDLVMSLATIAYNILRAIGQATLIGPDSPVRHPAKRRRLKTVMQEIIGIGARVTRHARRSVWAWPNTVLPLPSSSVIIKASSNLAELIQYRNRCTCLWVGVPAGMRSPVPRKLSATMSMPATIVCLCPAFESNIQSLFYLKRISLAVIAYFHPLNPTSRIQELGTYDGRAKSWQYA